MKKEIIGSALGILIGLLCFYAFSPVVQTYVNGFVTDMTSAKTTISRPGS